MAKSINPNTTAPTMLMTSSVSGVNGEISINLWTLIIFVTRIPIAYPAEAPAKVNAPRMILFNKIVTSFLDYTHSTNIL
jgi:hypothetical protein